LGLESYGNALVRLKKTLKLRRFGEIQQKPFLSRVLFTTHSPTKNQCGCWKDIDSPQRSHFWLIGGRLRLVGRELKEEKECKVQKMVIRKAAPHSLTRRINKSCAISMDADLFDPLFLSYHKKSLLSF
jgi:hypothetical protein